MFNNKVQRYSIRKLTVGAASVLIGVAFLSGANAVHADEANDANISKNTPALVEKAPEATKPAETDTAANVKTDDSKVTDEKAKADQAAKDLNESKVVADTNKKENTDSAKDKAADTFNVTIKTVNDATGKSAKYWNYRTGKWEPRDITLTNVEDGKDIGSVEKFATIPGLKLLNPEVLEQNFKIDKSSAPYDLVVNGKNVDITLHYAPLSNIRVEYVNEANGNVISSADFPTWKLTDQSFSNKHGDEKSPIASRYEAAAITIPGYELVSEPIFDGQVGNDIKFKDNPNYTRIIFKYKKVMKNEDAVTTSSANGHGAQIAPADGWSDMPLGFEISGVYGLKYTSDNGDVEQRIKDVIDHYTNQGYTYVGMTGKPKNDDYYNFLTFGYDFYLVPNAPVTVNYVDEQGNKLADSDTIQFNRNNPDQTNNGIDKTKYWAPKGTWTTKPKDIKGYHLVKVQGAETGEFTSYNYITTYVYAKNVKGQVTYIDDTTKTTLDNIQLPEAKPGDKINYTTAEKIQHYLNSGYKLVSNGFKDGNEVYKKDGNNFEVHLVHDYIPVEPNNPGKPGEPINPNDPEGPKFPNGTDAKSLTKTVTITVDYVDENGKSLVDHPISQSVTLNANGVLDKVTGDWKTPLTWDVKYPHTMYTPSFKDYHVTNVVTVEGNIPCKIDQKTGDVSPIQVTHENNDTKIVVHLAQNDVTGTVTYIDDTTGKVLKTDSLGKGKIGSLITYKSQPTVDYYLSKGYKKAISYYVDGLMHFAPDNNNYEIHLAHDYIPVEPNNPGKPDEPINPNDPEGPKFPNGTDAKSLTKTIARIVDYVDENGNSLVDHPVLQGVTLEGQGILDKVTGEWKKEITWNSSNFDAINTPSIDGYHVTSVTTEGNIYYAVDQKTGNVSATPVTHENGDTKVIVHFSRNEVNGTVTYIDDTIGKTLKTENIGKGKIGSQITYTTQDKIDEYVNKGYQLSTTNFTDGKMYYQKDGNNFEVHLIHQLVPVEPNNPGKPGEPINPNDPDGPKFPNGTDESSLTKVINRTVNYVDENGKSISGSITQTATMTGAGVLDKVTGKWTTPLSWKDGNFEAINTPSINGYHVTNVSTEGKLYYNVDSQGNVPSAVVTHEDGDTVVTVHFAKDTIPATGKITYIDDVTGKTIRTDNVKGNVGEKINYTTADKIKNFEDKGYKLVSNDFKDGSIFNKDGNNYEVHFVHELVPVDPKNPGKPGEPINPNDPEGPKFPNGTDAKSLTKTVTRTVKYVDENGKSISNSITQTVTLPGHGVIDKVTGDWSTKVSWTDGNFDGIKAPNVNGYHVTSVSTEGNVYYTVDNNGDVPSTAVTHENGNTVVTVHFTKNTPEVVSAKGTITYIDDVTGKTIRTDNVKGNVGEKINYTTADKIKSFEDKGYKLVSNNFNDGSTIFNKDGNNYEVHFVHELVPVTPEKPGKPGEPINPNDPEGPKFPNGTDTKSLTKTVTRTINYVDENGKKIQEPITQTVTVTGSGVIDKVTGEWNKNIEWSKGQFDGVNTPSVDGYKVTNITTEGNMYYHVDNNGNVPTTVVTHENGNTVVTIHFEKTNQPTSPQPTNPSTPENPTNPTNPSTPTETVVPKPEDPEVPTTPDTNEPETVRPHATKEPKVEKKAVKKATKKAETVKPHATKIAKAEAAKAQLPQTGEKQSLASIIGLAMVSALSFLGLASKKRKN